MVGAGGRCASAGLSAGTTSLISTSAPTCTPPTQAPTPLLCCKYDRSFLQILPPLLYCRYITQVFRCEMASAASSYCWGGPAVRPRHRPPHTFCKALYARTHTTYSNTLRMHGQEHASCAAVKQARHQHGAVHRLRAPSAAQGAGRTASHRLQRIHPQRPRAPTP